MTLIMCQEAKKVRRQELYRRRNLKKAARYMREYRARLKKSKAKKR